MSGSSIVLSGRVCSCDLMRDVPDGDAVRRNGRVYSVLRVIDGERHYQIMSFCPFCGGSIPTIDLSMDTGRMECSFCCRRIHGEMRYVSGSHAIICIHCLTEASKLMP
jgi:hypothetical protein